MAKTYPNMTIAERFHLEMAEVIALVERQAVAAYNRRNTARAARRQYQRNAEDLSTLIGWLQTDSVVAGDQIIHAARRERVHQEAACSRHRLQEQDAGYGVRKFDAISRALQLVAYAGPSDVGEIVPLVLVEDDSTPLDIGV